MKLIDVMIQVNDHRNGNYCGRCGGIHIADFIDLEPHVLPEPRCTLRGERFSIHRKPFTIRGHSHWVGNWCWDSIMLTWPDAASLIAHVLSQRWREHQVWGIDCARGDACIRLSERVSAGEVVAAGEWLRAMQRARVFSEVRS